MFPATTVSIFALVPGFALGIFYFGSLWITVRELPITQWPIRLIVGSYISRLIIAGLGFYLIMDGHWERSIFAIMGFILARTLLIRRIGIKPRRE
ncbi:MAG: ATP synthase subunit I [Spirulinaceae cyanobacterium]